MGSGLPLQLSPQELAGQRAQKIWAQKKEVSGIWPLGGRSRRSPCQAGFESF